MIVLFATDWNASSGGINAFNIELARGLARTGYGVACAVTTVRTGARQAAEKDGVALIKVPASANGCPTRSCGTTVVDRLKQLGLGPVQLWIGHDLMTGEAAISAADEHGGKLALIHHMDYISYQNFGGDRGTDATRNHKRQISMFADTRATLFGVGSWLKRNVELLGKRDGHLLVPGFPRIEGSTARAGIDQLRIVAAGRFEEKTEPLKRISAAVDGFARAVRDGRATLSTLARPTMTVVGVDEVAAQQILFERAGSIAGCPVNLVPAAFDPNPAIVAEMASRSHLVIVPSRHEGFGLVGWEAIGTDTPLIIGEGTGLADLLKETLDGQEDGLIQILPLDGSSNDTDLISAAILKVAGDLPRALKRAMLLRERLVSELACTWDEAARTILRAMHLLSADATTGGGGSPPGKRVARYRDTSRDYFPKCVELGLSAGQGSESSSTEVIAELRFGVTEINLDGIEAALALDRATLEVKPRGGRLARSDRLGEGTRSVPGISARAGGVWLISNPVEAPLLGRVLGIESLCIVEASSDAPMSIDVEVTALKRDIRCDINMPKHRLSKATEKVMGVFLKDCIWKPDSGHVVLSSASLREIADDQ